MLLLCWPVIRRCGFEGTYESYGWESLELRTWPYTSEGRVWGMLSIRPMVRDGGWDGSPGGSGGTEVCDCDRWPADDLVYGSDCGLWWWCEWWCVAKDKGPPGIDPHICSCSSSNAERLEANLPYRRTSNTPTQKPSGTLKSTELRTLRSNWCAEYCAFSVWACETLATKSLLISFSSIIDDDG